MSNIPNPLEALMQMGFRNPLPNVMPHADSLSVDGPMSMAVNILSAALRGENAAGVAEFMQLALKAVEANGYGLTYAAGPAGEFGILVVPMDRENGVPNLEKAEGDYCLAFQLGTTDQVLATIAAANPIPKPRIPASPYGCEGHYDDDYALKSGAGIGEVIYCDGSCAPVPSRANTD